MITEPKQGKLVKCLHVTDINTAQSGFGQSHIWRVGQSLEASFILCSCFAGNTSRRPDHPGSDSEAGGEGADE